MDFSISPAMQGIIQQVREIIQAEVYPLEPEFLQGHFREVLPALAQVREKVKQHGLWAPQIAPEYGGMGLSLQEFALVAEELGKSPLGHYVFNCQAPDAGNMEILALFGTDHQKAQYLRPLVRGEIRSCFSMTEPELPGSNPTWLAATAVKDGDDYVINGHKWFSSAADGATFAVVMAVTHPDAPRHEQASMILVPTDTPGFYLVRNTRVMGEQGQDWASHGEIRYENCRVPHENLLGREGMGFRIAQERLGPGRIHHCMRWIGICQRSLDLMCQRAASRPIAPGEPLASRQIIQSWIADSRAEIDAARWMVLHAAWKIDHQGQHAARQEISLIKFFAANALQRVVDRAIQVHGGLGVTDYTPLSYFYRHERGARIYDGADEVHKGVVARRILKDYGVSVKV